MPAAAICFEYERRSQDRFFDCHLTGIRALIARSASATAI